MKRKMKTQLKKTGFVLFTLVVLLLSAACGTGRATNASESNASQDIVSVSPNQSAFVIPATGGNLSDQTQFESAAYLATKKVALKRIVIDKDHLGDKYVPKTYVILVNRTPVSRSWTGSLDTGTTSKDEALYAESNESIQVGFQISIAASVQDENAALYLYNYPTTKLQDPQVGGVYIATELAIVVDNQVHQYLLKILGDECASRDLKTIIKEKAKIVARAEEETIKTFAKQGITISYVGLGGELSLQPEIQKAINDTYIAQQKIEIAKQNAQVMGIEAEAYRNAAVTKGKGDADALKAINDSIGGNAANLGSALEGYRWNGSRVTVQLAPEGNIQPSIPVVPVPVATPAPVQPTPTATKK